MKKVTQLLYTINPIELRGKKRKKIEAVSFFREVETEILDCSRNQAKARSRTRLSDN